MSSGPSRRHRVFEIDVVGNSSVLSHVKKKKHPSERDRSELKLPANRVDVLCIAAVVC